MNRVSDKVIIVTGAAQGMGEATSRLLVAEGAHVIVADVNDSDGRAVAEALGSNATYAHLDVASGEEWKALIASVIDHHGKVDGLVNNAAIFFSALIEDTEEAALRNLLDIDLIGPWLGMKAVVPHMKAARTGSIVNISSVEGLIGHCGRTGYTAAKWGLRAMTKTLAKEVGPFGVRCNSVQPGAIDTPMLRNGLAGTEVTRAFPEIAMNRAGSPDEVAAATLFLLSDDSSYVSGADLTVDGGWTCGAYSFNKPKAD